MTQQNTNSEVKSMTLDEFNKSFGVEFSNTEEGKVAFTKIKIANKFCLDAILTIGYIANSPTVDEKMEKIEEYIKSILINNVKNSLIKIVVDDTGNLLELKQYDDVKFDNLRIENRQEIYDCLLENKSNYDERTVQFVSDGLILSKEAYERFLEVYNVTK